ncbi:MAG: polysaccharide deacetylase family protein [Actinomycetota bacterium]
MTNLLHPAKDLLYACAKAGGFFPWARRRLRDSLCILCYHGFSFADEHLFRPKLFLTPELFRQRIQYLKRAGYAALPLDEAITRLRRGRLGGKELVITIDDGFHSVAALAAPILKEAGFTATIYVTTYYVRCNNPIFRLAMQYLFWKTSRDAMDCTGLPPEDDAILSTRGDRGEALLWRLIDFGETRLDETGRMALAREVGRRLAVDFDELVASRRLSLLSEEEVTDLARQGFDIQLHTHRHRLPEDSSEARRELRENRAVLEPLSRTPLTHLCYPSGVWSRDLWPVLAAEGVATATTCDPGRNYASTPPLGLKRFLDFQTISPIVFEAEVSGFSEVLRRLARRT